MEYLTFALAKGRLAKNAIVLFKRIGIISEEIHNEITSDSRKLIFRDEKYKNSFFLAKANDVPTYVEYGAADIGVAGADTLLEENRDLYQVADLGFGQCKVVVAGYPEIKSVYAKSNNIRVVTKYPRIATDFFYQTRKQTAEIIKLNGSVELGPIVGLSDVIVDIVETGSTLKENGLIVLEEICKTSARLVINRVSMKTDYDRVANIIEKIKSISN